jgi:hypothetical protein
MTLHSFGAFVSTIQNASLHFRILMEKKLIILNINIFKFNVEAGGLTRFMKSHSSMTVRAISSFLNFEPPNFFARSTIVMVNGIVQKRALKTPQSRGVWVKPPKLGMAYIFLGFWQSLSSATLRRF